MISDQILEFMRRHEGLCVSFKISTHLDNCVIICFFDPWNKNVSFDYPVKQYEMNHHAFIKYIIDKAEKEMYGEKEEHNEQ